jgi:hypothetical protein
MKIEKQVCSLEVAKKLHELGLEQKSLFYWLNGDIVQGYGICAKISKVYSAFTVAELGEMLPASILEFYHFETSKYIAQDYFFRYSGGYYNLEGYTKIEFIDKNEANLRAKILIYLLENKLFLKKGEK